LHHVLPTPKTDTETDTGIFHHAKFHYNCSP